MFYIFLLVIPLVFCYDYEEDFLSSDGIQAAVYKVDSGLGGAEKYNELYDGYSDIRENPQKFAEYQFDLFIYYDELQHNSSLGLYRQDVNDDTFDYTPYCTSYGIDLEECQVVDGNEVVLPVEGGRRLQQVSPNPGYLNIYWGWWRRKLCDFCEKFIENNCPEDSICDNDPWTCNRQQFPLVRCGNGRNFPCYCDTDIDGLDVCWEDDFCINRPRCYRNSDCLSDEVCIATCCDNRNPRRYRCFKECPNPFPPTPEPTSSPSESPSKKPTSDPTQNPTETPECCRRISGQDWSCGQPWPVCGRARLGNRVCLCDYDTERNWWCWADNWCSNLRRCRTSANCRSNERCIPNTCCGHNVCIDKCTQITNPNPWR